MNVSKVAKAGFLYTQTGTPYYASPEVWNDKPYNSKSDIWSLGCVLYESLTLHPPFRAQNMNDLYKRVVKGAFDDPPSSYSRDLKRLIKSMITVQPDLRPSATQILESREVAKAIRYFNIDVSATIPDFDKQSTPGKHLGLATITHATEEEKGLKSNTELLKTIQLPKNLKNLGQRLPKAQYEDEYLMMTPERKKNSEHSNNPQEPDADASSSMPRLNKIGEGRISLASQSNNGNVPTGAKDSVKREKQSRERIHPQMLRNNSDGSLGAILSSRQ